MIDMKLMANELAATPGEGRAVLFVGLDGRLRAKLAGGVVVEALEGVPGAQGVQGVPGAQGGQGLPGAQGVQGLPGSDALTNFWAKSNTADLAVSRAGVAAPGLLLVGGDSVALGAGCTVAGSIVVDTLNAGSIQLSVKAGGLTCLFNAVAVTGVKRVCFEFELVLESNSRAFALCRQSARDVGTAIPLVGLAASSISGVFDGSSKVVEVRAISAGLMVTYRMCNLSVRGVI